MTSLCWRHASEAQQWLDGKETCSEVLRLLARLPLLDVAAVQHLLGLRGGASLYRSVSRLREAGLVAAIQPPVYRIHSPRLLYLTDLGLTSLGLQQDADPYALARRLRLRGEDLLALVPRLPDLLAMYELLGALAASRPGRPHLVAWERPWRRSYLRPMGRTTASVTLPAHAVISWEHLTGSYLLLPDRGTVPLRRHRATLVELLSVRRSRGGHLPTLVIATTSRERREAWHTLLSEVTGTRRERPLAMCVAEWHDVREQLHSLPATEREERQDHLSCPIDLPPLRPRRAQSRLPRLIDDTLNAPVTVTPDDPLGRIARVVTPTDHELLEQIGLHPFLCPQQLADVLGWEVPSVRRRMNRLQDLGLLRRLTEDEIGGVAESELIELTERGLELVAAHLGLSLAVGVREVGLTGGGPVHSFGPRRALLRNLSHTREADEMFVRFYRLAREQAATGSDDAMEEWQNAAACSRRDFRPDGYGVYRRRGVSHGFFLELDRGTMNARDYFRKFSAYYRYGTSGRFRRDYRGYPTILLIAPSNASEERVARVARAAEIGQPGKLPLLLTCRRRIDDPNNPDGLLGPVWRQPDTEFDTRRCWLSSATGPPQGSTQATMRVRTATSTGAGSLNG